MLLLVTGILALFVSAPIILLFPAFVVYNLELYILALLVFLTSCFLVLKGYKIAYGVSLWGKKGKNFKKIDKPINVNNNIFIVSPGGLMSTRRLFFVWVLIAVFSVLIEEGLLNLIMLTFQLAVAIFGLKSYILIDNKNITHSFRWMFFGLTLTEEWYKLREVSDVKILSLGVRNRTKQTHMDDIGFVSDGKKRKYEVMLYFSGRHDRMEVFESYNRKKAEKVLSDLKIYLEL